MAIEEKLAGLRASCRENRSVFAIDQIGFLKNLKGISRAIRTFVEICEELEYVETLGEATDILERLSVVKGGLKPFAVGKRVAKEMRELNERLPAIRAKEDSRKGFMIESRILDLERTPPQCHKGHKMVVRNGSRGYFWGCSQYPFCHQTAQITSDQRMQLAS